MSAILWKELRENLKWCAAGFVGVSIAMAAALSTRLHHGLLFQDHRVLIDEGFLLVIGLSTAVLGLSLGILHVAFESRGDRWALLVHRPLSRSTIFAGKAIVGLGLYTTAAGLPFLIACLFVAAPGHLPGPFTWRMMLPGTAEIAAGVAYYFAGLLVAIRQARWYGSRALPAGAAFLASMFVVAAAQFWLALLAVFAVAAVLALAAWGSFLAGGRSSGLPRLGKVALAVILFSGAVVAGAGIAGAVAGSIDEVWQERIFTTFEMDRQGKVLRLTYKNSVSPLITDVDGVVPDEYRDIGADWATIDGRIAALQPILLPGESSWPFVSRHYWMDVGADLLDAPREIFWYYLRDEGLLAAYGGNARRLIKYVGPEEESVPPRMPAKRFPRDGWVLPLAPCFPRLLVFPDAVYRVAGDGQRLERIFAAPDGDPVEGAGYVRHGDAGPAPLLEVAVATHAAVQGLSREGKTIFKVARKPEWTRRRSLWAFLVGNLGGGRIALWYGPKNPSSSHDNQEEAHVQVVDASGKLESESQVPLGAEIPRALGATEWAMETLVPLFFQGVAVLKDAGPFGWVWPLDPPLFLRLWPLGLILAAVCGAFTWTLARRLGLERGRLAFWSAMGILFGLFALITLACLEEWPAREACGACGKRRAVNRVSCEHCHAPWPAPALDGTEIFA